MGIVIHRSSLSYPSSSKDLFGRDGPLFVEVGVGSGGFIDDLALRRPDVNVLGVDRAPQSIARSYRRLRSRSLPNARLIKAAAEFVVRNVLSPGGLQRLYVNYPDPWARRKHHHRRLLQHPFFGLLTTRLAPDGDVLLTTDHEEYFRFALKNAEDFYEIEVRQPPSELLDTKWGRRGSDHFHASLKPVRRLEDYATDIEFVDEMYHAVLQGNLPALSFFETRTFKHRDGVAVVVDAYRQMDGSGYAFLVHVEENSLSQEVVVEVGKGRNGYVVSLKRFGEPLHTRGVGEAVRFIAEWLAQEGMTIVHRKY